MEFPPAANYHAIAFLMEKTGNLESTQSRNPILVTWTPISASKSETILDTISIRIVCSALSFHGSTGMDISSLVLEWSGKSSGV